MRKTYHPYSTTPNPTMRQSSFFTASNIKKTKNKTKIKKNSMQTNQPMLNYATSRKTGISTKTTRINSEKKTKKTKRSNS